MVGLLVAAAVSSGAVAPLAVLVPAAADPVLPQITRSPEPNPGNSRSPTWEFSVAGGGQLSCRLSGPGTPDPPYVACTSPVTYSLAGQPDGTYTFAVRKQPAASTSPEPPATSAYVLDTTVPVTITSGPVSRGNLSQVSWTFTAETTATFECQLALAGQPAPGFTSCTSGAPFTLSADGTYTFTVQATDALANTGPPASATYTRDTEAPSSPTMTAEPTSPGGTAAVSWSFDAPGAASTFCQVTRDGTALAPFASCPSPASYTLPGDGTYVFFVRAGDDVGNQSEATASSEFVLDATGPPPPQITARPGVVGRNTNPAWSFTAEAGASTFCQLSPAGPNPTGVSPCAGTQSYSVDTDGAYVFSVYATDAFGRSSATTSDTYVLDRVAPAAPVITELTSPQTGATPTWAFTAEDGAVPTCRLLQGGTVVSSGCSAARSATYSLTRDGAYTFSVFVTDAAGNVSATAMSGSYVLDRTAPVAPVITGGPGAAGADETVQWSFSAEFAASTSCQLQSPGLPAPGFSACSTPTTARYILIDEGSYTFSVRATDAAGNTGPPVTSKYTLDRTAPAAPSITSAPPSRGNDVAPTWAFTAERGAKTSCQLRRGAMVVEPFAPCSQSRTYTLTTDGVYVFSVRATDAAGNTGPPATSTYSLDATAPETPTISSAPASPGRDREPTWFFTTEPGAAASCQLRRGATVVEPFARCSRSRTYTLTADGTYVFSVRATDAAGNISPVSSATYVLDRTAPAPPVIRSGPASPGADQTPTWSFTTEPGTTTECQLASATNVVTAWAPCSGSRTYRLEDRSARTYLFSVRSVDAAGNASSPTTAIYFFEPAAPKPPAPGVPPTTSPVPVAPTPTTPASQSRPGTVVPAPARPPADPVTLVAPDSVAPSVEPAVSPTTTPTTTPRPERSTARTGRVGPSELDAGEESAAPLPAPRSVHEGSEGVAETIKRGVQATVEKSAFPFLLIVIVLLFLLVQDRIDRRDPKLALAPVYRDPDLKFTPPPSRRRAPHD